MGQHRAASRPRGRVGASARLLGVARGRAAAELGTQCDRESARRMTRALGFGRGGGRGQRGVPEAEEEDEEAVSARALAVTVSARVLHNKDKKSVRVLCDQSAQF